MKREERYYKFKLDVSYRDTERETDLVLEVTPPEVGHLKISVPFTYVSSIIAQISTLTIFR